MMTLKQLLPNLDHVQLYGPGDLRSTSVTKGSSAHIDGALCSAN